MTASKQTNGRQTVDDTSDHDSHAAAKAAGLRYTSDRLKGISRRRAGRGFTYISPDGTTLHDPSELKRIKALAIPPAWTSVWISPHANGHIQATGRDEKGRKQYRYHNRWREVRDETKYTRMIDFGKALPHIRERVDKDLSLQGLPREKVLATVVRLLETTHIRVGNEEYARTNRHYGLTTMLDRHVAIHGSHVTFKFRGKSNVLHNIDLADRRLARIVKKCRDLPGQHLFAYIDSDGTRQAVESHHVNEYLHEIAGHEFTAKDFRTWAGTVLAAMALQAFESFDTKVQAKKNVVHAIESVAANLGNTPAVCRKCYVHPVVLESYLDGTMLEVLKKRTADELKTDITKLKPEEVAVLALLQQRLTRETAKHKGAKISG